MPNLIIIAVLIPVIIFGFRETIKHFKGEGACCGGTTSKPKKKKLKSKICCTYNFHVEGMHCKNCANAVIEAVNDIDGASAKVNLKKKSVKVWCDRKIDEKVIIEAINKRGYKVV